MGLTTAGDAPGCHAVHPPLRLGRGASGACSRNARRGEGPGVGGGGGGQHLGGGASHGCSGPGSRPCPPSSAPPSRCPCGQRAAVEPGSCWAELGPGARGGTSTPTYRAPRSAKPRAAKASPAQYGKQFLRASRDHSLEPVVAVSHDSRAGHH